LSSCILRAFGCSSSKVQPEAIRRNQVSPTYNGGESVNTGIPCAHLLVAGMSVPEYTNIAHAHPLDEEELAIQANHQANSPRYQPSDDVSVDSENTDIRWSKINIRQRKMEGYEIVPVSKIEDF
jgi:hypothetical protein